MIAVAAEQRFSAGACSPIDLAVAPRLALEAAPVLYEPQAAF
jgi:N6-L-threonylcarbamoyladenine synthase